MKKFIAWCGVSLALVTLAACNTVAGIGADLEAAGEAIEDAAEDAKDD
ncbi:MAG: entericidin A/B family lipoprotein [Hyphomonadaceae bacterium]|nr:entericidin A/B family lipoprotein [Hyphomonadaceae bacterium]